MFVLLQSDSPLSHLWNFPPRRFYCWICPCVWLVRCCTLIPFHVHPFIWKTLDLLPRREQRCLCPMTAEMRSSKPLRPRVGERVGVEVDDCCVCLNVITDVALSEDHWKIPWMCWSSVIDSIGHWTLCSVGESHLLQQKTARARENICLTLFSVTKEWNDQNQLLLVPICPNMIVC